MARHGRTVIRSLGLTAVTGALLVASTTPALAAQDDDGAKNIILLIGDGMGRTHVTAGRERFYGAAGRLNMEKAPVVGQVATWAVEEGSAQPALVTDSASSATAWSSGVKTYNAALGVDSKGAIVPTLMEQAKKAGMRTGNVSTAEITDATPAGMMSHVLLRGCQGPVFTAASCLGGRATPTVATTITPVAEQIARNGTADVILGGGLSRFEPDDAAGADRPGLHRPRRLRRPGPRARLPDRRHAARRHEDRARRRHLRQGHRPVQPRQPDRGDDEGGDEHRRQPRSRACPR